METQIKKLIELAKKYEAFGIEHYLKSNSKFTTLREDESSDNLIEVYFADNYTTCSVSFGKVEVVLYANKIDLPFGITTQKLTKIHDSANEFLINMSDEKKKELEAEAREGKEKEVADLKKRLNFLENENS